MTLNRHSKLVLLSLRVLFVNTEPRNDHQESLKVMTLGHSRLLVRKRDVS